MIEMGVMREGEVERERERERKTKINRGREGVR